MAAVVVMGVCGSGKTTVGKALANKVSCPFEDADKFHSLENIQKMTQGLPLTDEDRSPWLSSLHKLLHKWVNSPSIHSATTAVCGVLACSALKKSYRHHLIGKTDNNDSKIETQDITKQCIFVYLHGPSDIIRYRMSQRGSHYMPSSLLESQLSLLEEPLEGEENCLWCDITDSVSSIVDQIVDKLIKST